MNIICSRQITLTILSIITISRYINIEKIVHYFFLDRKKINTNLKFHSEHEKKNIFLVLIIIT